MSLTAKQITQKNQTQQVLTQVHKLGLNRFVLYRPRAWYNAESVIKDSSNSVSQMNDLSGNNYHLQQPIAAKQPLWTDNQLNGKPVISFDGIDDFMTVNFGQTFEQPNTFFIVFSSETAPNSAAGIFDGITDHGAVFTISSDNTLVAISSNSTTINQIKYNKTSPFNYILSSIIYNNTNSVLLENGVVKDSGILDNLGFSDLQIGRRTWLNTTYSKVNIAELIFYDRLLNSRERQYIENYLMNKYAL
jgi:hypothetical protein